MKFYFFIFFTLVFSFVTFSQASEIEDLPDPDPRYATNEYEMIILDGDTVLRSNITKEVFDKNFRKVDKNAAFSTDWMNQDWDTKKFNPYEDEKINWPLTINFSGELFTMPIEGQVTSRYGWRKGRPHRGIDLDLVTGDNVKVVLDGKVRFARYYSGFGNCVVVRHNNGLETIYAHLSKILVQPNTFVSSGQVIGKGGNTGRSYGSHLHFEVRYKNKAIHPEYLFDLEGTKTFTSTQVIIDDMWADPRKHRSYKKSNIQVRSNALYNPNAGGESTLKKPTAQNQNNNTEDFRKTESNSGSFTKETTSTPNSFIKGSTQHIVVRGDTLQKIANQYKVTLDDLLRLNKLSKSSVIRIGQKIDLP